MTSILSSIGPFGTPEMIIMAILVLVLFGAKKLPTFGRSLLRSMGEFRRAKEDFERELHRSLSRGEDRDLPSADDFEVAERLLQKTFRPRFSWRGRNGIVVLMLLVCVLLLTLAIMR